MVLFILSLLALLAGPALDRGLARVHGAERFLDSFVVVSVGGLVLGHILPGALHRGGLLALVGLAAGLGLPVLAWALMHGGHALRRRLTIGAAMVGLSLHALLDGVALSHHGVSAEHGELLAVAVLLHRLPVGIAIWRVVRPMYGVGMAAAALATIVAATTAGTFGGEALEPLLGGRVEAVFQAMVGGALLHMVVGHGHDWACPCLEDQRAASMAGAVVAALAVGATVLLEPGHHHEVSHGALALNFGSLVGLVLFVRFRPSIFAIFAATVARSDHKDADCDSEHHFQDHTDHECAHHHHVHPECECAEDDH